MYVCIWMQYTRSKRVTAESIFLWTKQKLISYAIMEGLVIYKNVQE